MLQTLVILVLFFVLLVSSLMLRRVALRFVPSSYPPTTNRIDRLKRRELSKQAAESKEMKNRRDRGVFGLMKIVLDWLLPVP